ncbi:retaining alpha-galactosidase [Bacteroides faecalis]|uniref:Retaining alpha-galactosidase n=2 Tax=Bacteroides faecalis TaxID=2447885 RepID=A0A401LSM4_9BACE|nr:retaining alpha-galactosidase [Bacteroides faecalis]
MNMTKKISTWISILFFSGSLFSQENIKLKSPNEKLSISVQISDVVNYALSFDDDIIVENSQISMKLANGKHWGIKPRLRSKKMFYKNEKISTCIYKKSEIQNEYNELILKFHDNYNLIFRAYNEGMAWRFESEMKTDFIVNEEQATFNFPRNFKAYIPYVKSSAGYENLQGQLMTSFESLYEYIHLSEWDDKRLAFAPIMVECDKGRKVVITEADLINYPGMYLHNKNKGKTLYGFFAPYPDVVQQNSKDIREEIILSRKNYIAKCSPNTCFPWRIIIVAKSDVELLGNDMVYKLSTPAKGDFSWVKPGKVTWDWWNALNLFGVDFKTGINTDTYKYYIDFASQNGLEYIIMDEGWSDLNNLYQVVPEIDLKNLIAYSATKNVGIILWLPYYGFAKDMENICKYYSEMGIKGFKIDFMNRDDQPMVYFHYQAAKIAAKYHLLVDFHGTYKPTGLQRTFPNVLNFEGVFGLENMKWSGIEHDMVTYDVTLPFIRLLAGPADYTPGAMCNANKENYRPVHSQPMSQGTRCRQLAQYIIFDSPLCMLADSPSNYQKEQECTQFISRIPTVWDETIALEGKIAQYIAMARRKDNVWYLGVMTNWNKRDLELDLSFLGDGMYTAEVFCDGINADRVASDYVRVVKDVSVEKKMKVTLMPGGGCVMRIEKKQYRK